MAKCVSRCSAGCALLSALACCNAIQLQDVGAHQQGNPSLFVYVFSRVDGIERRAEIRDMWLHASQSVEVHVSYKFAVCGGANGVLISTVGDDGVGFDEADEKLKADLKAEIDQFNDVVYLACEEGYSEGALTRKSLACMKDFQSYRKRNLFMKIDDDSFLAMSRYLPRLMEVGNPNLYMGIPIGEGAPCREENSRWYEPYLTFNKTLFPKGMSGGSGYTIGNNLVNIILDTGIAEANILFNEDRAVAVWMDIINNDNDGTTVDYQGIPGIDGFWAWDWEHPTENWATWGSYPHTVHHGLEGKTIGCLAKADNAQDNDKEIGNCFEAEVGKIYEPLTCAVENKEARDVQRAQRQR